MQHIAVEEHQIGIGVEMGVVIAAEAVIHIGDGITLALIIACREQDVDLFVISCHCRIVGHILVQGTVIDAVPLLKHGIRDIIAVFLGIGIICLIRGCAARGSCFGLARSGLTVGLWRVGASGQHQRAEQ